MNDLISYLKEKNIVIPMYLYRMRDKFSLSLDEFFFLMYLFHQGEKILFNLPLMASDFGLDVKKIMGYISVLQEKKLINIEVLKNDKNIIEEYISLSPFFDKLTIILKEEVNNKNSNESTEDVFELIENCFGRSLNSIEREIIKAWFEHNYTEELIKEAVKEAALNGVHNIKYIDRILYEWNKKGFKNKNDVDKNKENFRRAKEKVEVFDCDWLDDEE